MKALSRIHADQHFRSELHEYNAHEIARVAMQDLTMLLFTVVFFSLAFLYVKACQKLR